LGEPTKLFDLSFSNDIGSRTDKYNVSLTFPSSDLVAVSDGCGNLILCKIIVKETETWETIYRAEKLCDDHAFIVLDSRTREDTQFVDLLVEYVEETEKRQVPSGEGALFASVLEWISFKKGSEAYSVTRRRRLRTKGNLDYAALSIDCNSVCCLTTGQIRFVYDSEKSVDDVEVEESREDTPKVYSWGQTVDQLCVVFTIGPQFSKNDVVWRLASESIHVGLEQQAESERILLDGELHLPVDVEGSTWTLEDGRLEVTLAKRDEGRMWPEVVNGDERGEYVADPELVKEVSERLKQFTSDSENPTAAEEIAKQPFNVQQLEECDALDTDASHLLWMDGETHGIIIEADTGGHQWLFNARLSGEQPPYICLRHDVDGILWRVADGPATEESLWSHQFTFNAFGYVQAGKPDRKFCTCSTDGSYAIVVDCTRHAYVYWQPSAVDTDLRNRKTGQRVSKVAKQQLISISGGGSDTGHEFGSLDILGVAAFDDILLLLTENRFIGVFLK